MADVPSTSRTRATDPISTGRPVGAPHLDLVLFSKSLSPEVCATLIDLGRSFPVGETLVVSQDMLADHRVCETHLIDADDATGPLYRLLESVAGDVADHHYALELSGIVRMPHYVEYHAGRGHFDWHNDYSHESSEAPRKLTVVIQLSDPTDYEGGDFEVFGPVVGVAPRDQGAIFCLPSIIPHRVTPVTRGVRKAIVAWIAGPRFR
jgi:PKHD-type hydroxylase